MAPVTRAVNLMSAAYHSVANGRRSLFHYTFSPQYFPRFLGTSMVLSFCAGFQLMEIQTRNEEQQLYNQAMLESQQQFLRSNNNMQSAGSRHANLQHQYTTIHRKRPTQAKLMASIE